MRRFVVGAALCAVVAGCTNGATDFPVTPSAQSATSKKSTIPFKVIPITEKNAATASPKDVNFGSRTTLPSGGRWVYRVGRGDILSVLVYDHPELTLPAGPQRSAVDSGQPVENNGTFFFPYVGQVPAAGLTPADIRVDLTKKLAKYIPNPQVDVHVAAYNSQSVSVTGEVMQPAREPLTQLPLTLVQGVDAAGGLKPDADTSQISVRRGGRLFHVDLRGFLEGGQTRNNPILQPGDVVNVPKQVPIQAFVLGSVTKPAPVDLTLGPVTLTAALATEGGLKDGTANPRGVFVFRLGADKKVDVYQLDATTPLALVAATEFYLKPKDVIYVTTRPIAVWNQVIASLLPTITGLYQVSYLRKNL